MSHIEKAKAAINDRLATAYRWRTEPIMYHRECKGALAIVVRLLADPQQQTAASIHLLQELAKKTIEAIKKLDDDEKARLD